MSDKENAAAESKGPREISPNVAFLAFIVLALGYNFVVAYLNSDGNSNTDRASAVAGEYDDDSSAATGSGTEQTTTTQDRSLPGTIDADGMVTLPDGRKGRYNPYTKVFYYLTESPPDLVDYTCFGVPAGGTAYGSLLVGGDSTYTMSDVDSAIFIKDGVRYGIDPTIRAEEWDEEVWDVHPKNVGCTYNRND